MTDLRGTRFARLVSEFVVIVVGVLVALAADSAWGAKGERDREQVVLADLLAEFEVNDSILAADISSNAQAIERARSVVQELRGDASLSADSVAVLLGRVFEGGRFDPVTGSLRSVIDSGELRLIRNRTLRSALAGWGDRAEEARQTSFASHQVKLASLPLLLDLAKGPAAAQAVDRAVLGWFLWAARTPAFQQERLLGELRSVAELIRAELE